MQGQIQDKKDGDRARELGQVCHEYSDTLGVIAVSMQKEGAEHQAGATRLMQYFFEGLGRIADKVADLCDEEDSFNQQ